MKLTPEVEVYLKEIGLADRLKEVMAKAAIVTHPRGNRRYHHWVFEVRNGIIVSVFDLRGPQKPALTPDSFVAYEDCDRCLGKTCPACEGTGLIKVTRRLAKSA